MSAVTRPPVRRDPENAMVAGVAAGVARSLGVDPLVVRLAFVVATLASGLGIGLYVLGWVLLPAGPGSVAPAARLRTGRGAVEVALGVGLLVLSALLAFRALGVWPSDAIVWPVVLIAGGGALLWRASSTAEPTAEPAPEREEKQQRAATAGRTGLGVALVLAAALVFLEATGALAAARDVLLAALAVAVVVAVIGAPWIARLARSLAAERAARIRSQERAEVAAHLHDSVLQTLALVQQRADDPRAVATLARRQERELRAWLSGTSADGADATLRGALEAAAERVEEDHGVQIDVVAVGDRVLDERAEALVAAAREAMVNAAKFAGEAGPVSVYAEAGEDRTRVFVRDRGPGFEVAAVPAERHGVRESIIGRMERNGGHAAVRGVDGGGTEVELEL